MPFLGYPMWPVLRCSRVAAFRCSLTLEQVAEISKLDKKGEVFIAFENALGKERKLKIKSKHFKKLP